MRRAIIALVSLTCISGLTVSLFAETQKIFIWNVTDSAPRGLYRVASNPPQIGDWAIVSELSHEARWVSDNGYLAHGWPIVKRVSASEGDTVCRNDLAVSINGQQVARAFSSDFVGQILPSWSGCIVLEADEVFLLNEHPQSLDGRYFGVTKRKDLSGSGKLIWRQS